MGPVIPTGGMPPLPPLPPSRWQNFADYVAGNVTGKPVNQVDENAIRALGPRAAVSTFVMNTISNTAESIITATQVYADPESRPQEQAAAALRCFSSFSMIVAFTGPWGVAAGGTISALLGMITAILDAASPMKETEMQKLENLLRELEGEKQAAAIHAGQFLLRTQIAGLKDSQDHSQAWNDIKGPVTEGIAQYQLAVAFEWLNTPKNQKLEKWEEVFLAAAEAVIQIVRLLAKMFEKILPAEVGSLINVAKEWGSQIEDWMVPLMDTADECGDLWMAKDYGFHVKNPFQPPQANGRWENIDIGGVRSISVSPATDRIWAELSDYKLSTGTRGEMYVFNPGPNRLDIEGVIDVCLVPWAGGEAGDPFDMLLVTSAGADRKQTPKLMINEWYEKRRGRFYTKQEMEGNPPVWGFSRLLKK